MEWLKKEAYGWEVVRLIFWSVVLIIIINYTVLISVVIFHIDTGAMSSNVIDRSDIAPTLGFFLSMIWSVTIEEFLFRFLPLMIAVRATRSLPLVLGVAFAMSMLFGYMHGNLFNLLAQGTSGLVFCIVFLKCGGLNGKWIKPFASSISAHFLFNAFLTSLILGL